MTEKINFQHQDQDRVRLHLWDWKGQPDWYRINQSMLELFDPKHCPQIIWVEDSHRDDYVVFVSGTPLSLKEAQRLWDGWDWEYEEQAGRA